MGDMDYLIRGISDDLWKRVKALSKSNGTTIRFMIISGIKLYLKKTPPIDEEMEYKTENTE